MILSRWLHLAGTLLLTSSLATAQPAEPSPTTTAPATAPVLRIETQESLLATLNGERGNQKDRDEAARRLLLWRTPQAIAGIRDALVNVGNAQAQLAAVRAISTDPDPDTTLIDPLFALLGQSRQMVEAATDALRNYQGSPEVLSRLLREANSLQQREVVRVSVIHAAGAFFEKRSAESLMGLLTRPDEAPAIRAAASDALGMIAGRTDLGQDVAGWTAWWQQMQGLDEGQWRSRALASAAGRLARLQAQYQQLSAETGATLQESYRSAPDSQKVEIMLRMLRSGQPTIRATGALTMAQEQSEGRSVAQPARDALREMIGDSDARVRYEAIRALATSNDSGVLDALLEQLTRETQPPVQAAIASALEPMRDVRAVPGLLKLLERGEPTSAEAAADALKVVAEKLRKDEPSLARQVAGVLERIYVSGTATDSVRDAVLQAMVPLRDPDLLDIFLKLLTGEQTDATRRTALRGLGGLGDRNTADSIVSWLDAPDDGVRLEAVEALGKTGGFEYSEVLYRRINPAIETNAQVRQRAWAVLTSLLPSAPVDQLQFWADRFRDDPTRRLTVLEALRDRLIKDRDDEGLAIKRQEIGEEHMNLQQFSDAALSFRPALDYWSGQNKPKQITIEKLAGQLIRALLRSKQYSEAAQFAAQAIAKSTTNQEVVGAPIRAEAERLRDAGQFPDAMDLISESRKMSPALDSRYLDTLTQIEAEIRRKQG